MTFGLKPNPQTLPALLIERRRIPAVIPEAAVQASSHCHGLRSARGFSRGAKPRGSRNRLACVQNATSVLYGNGVRLTMLVSAISKIEACMLRRLYLQQNSRM